MEMTARNEFLYAAIEDKQGTIRAIDFKAEILLIAMSVPLMNITGISSAIIALAHNPNCSIATISCDLTILLVVGWSASFLLILRTIIAMSNPADAIPERSGATGIFYSGWLFPPSVRYLNPRAKITTGKSVGEHLAQIPNSDEDIGRELAFEQMKVTFICSRKIAHFNYSIWAIMASLCAGLILFLIHLMF